MIKKGFTIAVSVMTALWSVGIAAFVPMAAAAAPEAAATGDLVKASLPAVYYVGADAKRYVFPNEKTYKTWYADFSTVLTITDAELAAIAIGGNVTYRPGAKLVKITTDPKVYMVGANAVLHSIPDEATALAYFGSAWNTLIDDVPDAFFTNYSVGAALASAALGVGGKLPVGTVVMVEADSTYYFVGETAVSLISAADAGLYSALVKVADMAALEALVGTVSSPATINPMDAVQPDRTGTEEGGTVVTPTAGVTATVTTKSTHLQMASASSQNVGRSVVEICTDTALTIDGMKATSAAGTIGFNSIMAWWQLGDYIYEVTGTESGDAVAQFSASDSAYSLSAGGCVSAYFYSSTSMTSGVLRIDMTQLNYTTTGTAAAASATLSGKTMRDSSVVSVAATDLADIAFSSPTPAGGSTLQTDGTKQQVFGVQANVSNNVMYIPNIVFKMSGSIMVSDCEFRNNGVAVSTLYVWVGGRYLVFELPSDQRVFDEGTDNWTLWCDVDGEAGQSVTPQIVWPAPYFWLYDNVRILAATGAFEEGKEHVAPSASRMTQSVSSSLTLAGASATIEVVNLNNVTTAAQLDDEVTSGSTNVTVAVYKVKIRGDKATLANLLLTMAGTQAAKGMTNCQIKIGQRTDKGEISTAGVNLGDHDLSNYGGENNTSSAGTTTITSSKQMQVGDWLIVIECDIVTTAAAYANGDVMNIQLSVGATNISFDNGATANFPTAVTAGTTVTIRLLTAITVAADATVRYLVQNGTNQVMGAYTIAGPTQEGVNVTSIGVTFVAAVSGTTGCTTATMMDSSMTDLATAQSLANAGGTLTFSVTLSVAKNAEYVLYVVCTQASSAIAAATTANATTLATMSGTGQTSSQSFTATPATNGASLTVITNGTLTATQSTNQSARIIGPNKELLVLQFSITASIHEAQGLETIIVGLAAANNAVVNDLSQVRITGEGFTTSAAAVDLCTRIVTGATTTCNFSSEQVLAAGNTATISVYAKGNSFGSIAVAGGALADTVTPSVALNTTPLTSQLMTKGVESQANISPATATLSGRVVTPFASDISLVKQPIPSTTLPGQSDMDLYHADVIVSGSTLTLIQLDISCSTNDNAAACLNASLNDLEVDGTKIGGAVGFTTPDPNAQYRGVASFTTLAQALTIGTHSLRILSDNSSCTTGDNVQINLTRIGFSANDGASTDTLAVGVYGVSEGAESITEQFNAQSALTGLGGYRGINGYANLCG